MSPSSAPRRFPCLCPGQGISSSFFGRRGGVVHAKPARRYCSESVDLALAIGITVFAYQGIAFSAAEPGGLPTLIRITKPRNTFLPQRRKDTEKPGKRPVFNSTHIHCVLCTSAAEVHT